MRYQVAALLRSATGTERRAVVEAPIVLDDPQVRATAPVSGPIRLIRDNAGVLVVGQLQTSVEMACARCLAPVEVEVRFELSESFRPTVQLPGGPRPGIDDDGDPATAIDAEHVLDLTEVVRQAVLLALPWHPLCRPDCAGLCPHCGADLNVGRCSCRPEPDRRWEALRAMLDGL